jgi:hypothetical protein
MQANLLLSKPEKTSIKRGTLSKAAMREQTVWGVVKV